MPALARLLGNDIATTYESELPSAVACLDADFAACIAHLHCPLGHRRAIRTTNLLERLFGEARRRTKVIPHAFGERAVLKLVYAALTRAAERAGSASPSSNGVSCGQSATRSTGISLPAMHPQAAQWPLQLNPFIQQ